MFVDVSKDLRHVLVCGSFRPAFSRSVPPAGGFPVRLEPADWQPTVLSLSWKEEEKRDRHHTYDDRRVCDVRVKSVDRA